eukprot:scaffold1763_cov21-Prasinocladus_malaysianus.AAC.1
MRSRQCIVVITTCDKDLNEHSIGNSAQLYMIVSTGSIYLFQGHIGCKCICMLPDEVLQFEHHPLSDRHWGVPPRWEGSFGGFYLRTSQMSSK